jgi:hypothetical protein
MPALVAGIHVFLHAGSKTWMAGKAPERVTHHEGWYYYFLSSAIRLTAGFHNSC